eukprot:522089-Alexandrium_andersonii.AAC.1
MVSSGGNAGVHPGRFDSSELQAGLGAGWFAQGLVHPLLREKPREAEDACRVAFRELLAQSLASGRLPLLLHQSSGFHVAKGNGKEGVAGRRLLH